VKVTPPMKTVEIAQLFLIPTGSYQDQAMRPFEPMATSGALEALDLATNGFKTLEHGNLAPVAGLVMRPSAYSTGVPIIENGWGTERYQFMMKVVYHEDNRFDNPGEVSQRVKYIRGFTDAARDLSYSGLVDGQLQMTIESVIDT